MYVFFEHVCTSMHVVCLVFRDIICLLSCQKITVHSLGTESSPGDVCFAGTAWYQSFGSSNYQDSVDTFPAHLYSFRSLLGMLQSLC